MSTPKTILNQVPERSYQVVRGAALPIALRMKVNGVYQAWAATLTMTVKPQAGSAFDLTVGQGITLSVFNAVANAQAVVQLSEEQSNLVVKGDYTAYLVTEGAPGAKVPRLRGKLIGVDM